MREDETFFEEDVGALKEDALGQVLVGEKTQNEASVQRNATSGRNLAAVASSERRSEQVDRVRVGHLHVQVNVFVTAPEVTPVFKQHIR